MLTATMGGFSRGFKAVFSERIAPLSLGTQVGSHVVPCGVCLIVSAEDNRD